MRVSLVLNTLLTSTTIAAVMRVSRLKLRSERCLRCSPLVSLGDVNMFFMKVMSNQRHAL
jgi:hypothetical protein